MSDDLTLSKALLARTAEIARLQGALVQVIHERDEALMSRRQLTRALVEAAVPLEALYASVEWELAPEVKNSIALAVATIRATLSEAQR